MPLNLVKVVNVFEDPRIDSFSCFQILTFLLECILPRLKEHLQRGRLLAAGEHFLRREIPDSDAFLLLLLYFLLDLLLLLNFVKILQSDAEDLLHAPFASLIGVGVLTLGALAAIIIQEDVLRPLYLLGMFTAIVIYIFNLYVFAFLPYDILFLFVELVSAIV